MSLVGRPQPETTSLTKNCAEQPYVSFKTLSIKQPAVWLKVFFQLKVFFGLDGFVYTLYMPTCLLQGKRTCLHSVHGATRALGRHCDEWSQNVTKPCFLRSQKCNVGYFLQCYIKQAKTEARALLSHMWSSRFTLLSPGEHAGNAAALFEIRATQAEAGTLL